MPCWPLGKTLSWQNIEYIKLTSVFQFLSCSPVHYNFPLDQWPPVKTRIIVGCILN